MASTNEIFESDSGALLIWSAVGSIRATPWDGNALVRITDEPDPVGVFILTANQWGPFEVVVEELDKEPPVDRSWEDAVEFSVTADGPLEVSEVDSRFPSCTLTKAGGEYRVRVLAQGRAAVGRHDPGREDRSGKPSERYRIQSWPARPEQPRVIQMTSAFAASELDRSRANESGAVVVQESAEGLAAAGRIGRDADRLPGCRALTVQSGLVTLTVELEGTPSTLFGWFATVSSWTSRWNPDREALGWIYGTDAERPFQLGPYFYAYAGDDIDLLPGRKGAIRTRYVEVNRPSSVVRDWNWVPDEAGAQLLVSDSRLTISLEQVDAGRTRIHLRHEGLPVEWTEDMTSWWRFQLAIAERLGFRRRG